MKQIIYIHGGDCYKTEEDFCEALESRDFDPSKEKKKRIFELITQLKDKYQIIKPEMPNKYNARYKEWKIWFEKILPYLNDEGTILIGHSLGGTFLSKYLTENNFPKKINQLHLVSAVYDNKDLPEGEDYLADFLFDTNQLNKLENICDEIFLYHSTDDEVIPYSHIEKYKSQLSKAKLLTFTDRGHFNTETFPELLNNLK